MMKNINLTWKADGIIDSYTIYRAENESLDVNNLPPPLIAGVTVKGYTDNYVGDATSLHYRVASVKGDRSKISEEYAILIEANTCDCNSTEYIEIVENVEITTVDVVISQDNTEVFNGNVAVSGYLTLFDNFEDLTPILSFIDVNTTLLEDNSIELAINNVTEKCTKVEMSFYNESTLVHSIETHLCPWIWYPNGVYFKNSENAFNNPFFKCNLIINNVSYNNLDLFNDGWRESEPVLSSLISTYSDRSGSMYIVALEGKGVLDCRLVLLEDQAQFTDTAIDENTTRLSDGSFTFKIEA